MTNPSENDQAISKLLELTKELISLSKLDEAEKFLTEILRYKPEDLNVAFQRGTLFTQRGEHEKALEQFMQVHKKYPKNFEALYNIAGSYYNLKKYDDGIFYLKKALKIKPNTDFVMTTIAACYLRLGNVDETINYFRQAVKASPEKSRVHSDLLLAMIYAESVSPEQLTEEAKRFGRNIAKMYPEKTDFKNDKNKDRKIRIGYVSPDFRDHAIPYFLEPLLKHHDKEKFEIYAYSHTMIDNPIMERMKLSVDGWRDIRSMSIEESCNFIIEDNIDLLIDVTGHTAFNNLGIFASRAAPVQITWLGFPATTGLQTMDYRITDFYAEPPGMTEHLSTEKLWRLPHIFCVYMAHENSPNVIDHPPFEDNGYITFGCFNNFIKVRDSVIAAWSRILEQVPESKLLLEIDGIDDLKFLNKVQERLRRQKISLNRVIIEPRARSNQFILYNKIDIALDPFPCVGGTTSMDTLWMGVPLVTLAGNHFASRMGVTILSNAGMPELIAQSVDEYVSIAVELAKNRDALKKMRYNLRDRFIKSPAMDQKSFTADMEDAYRGMWHKYCNSSL